MHSKYKIAYALCLTAVFSACSDSNNKSGKLGVSSGKEDVILKIAHADEASGDLVNAERLYVQAVSSSGNTLESRFELSGFYERHQKQRLAIQVLEETLKLDSKNASIMRALANDYVNVGETDKAIALIDNAIAIDGKNGLLYNTKGVALDMKEDYLAAENAYLTGLSLDPDAAITIKTNLSMSYILAGSYDKAIELLLPYLGTSQTTRNMRQNLALAYGLKGDNQTAMKLGLKDLTQEEAEENLKFYRLLAKKRLTKTASAKQNDTPAQLPVIPDSPPAITSSKAEETLPPIADSSWTPAPKASAHAAIQTQSAPVEPVTMNDSEKEMARAPLVSATDSDHTTKEMHLNQISPSSNGDYEDASSSDLPVPALKPDKL